MPVVPIVPDIFLELLNYCKTLGTTPFPYPSLDLVVLHKIDPIHPPIHITNLLRV